MPKENGVFYVHVKLNEAHIPGSPFPMLIGKLGADPALVLAKGPGLEKGTAGRKILMEVGKDSPNTSNHLSNLPFLLWYVYIPVCMFIKFLFLSFEEELISSCNNC